MPGWTMAAIAGANFLGLGGGGGGQSAPTSQTITNTNIPDYARPYVENMLGATQQQLFNLGNQQVGTDAAGNPIYNVTGLKGYTPFGIGGTQAAGQYNPTTGQYDFTAPTAAQSTQTGTPTAGGAGMFGGLPAPTPSPYATGMGPQEMQAAQSAVAGYTPLQQQAQQGIGALTLPAAYQQGLNVTGQGIGGLFGLGAQAAGAGQNYANMATNPFAVGAYMNPYLQQALAPQMELLGQQQAQQGQQLASQASQAGAFGGSRYGLQQGLQNQANQLAMSNLVGQGYNQAYNQALQNMQYGAGLGLQGQQAAAGMFGQALGGGAQLANIGGQALQGQQGILGLQAQTGAQQQAQQQQILNQAIQNYANTINYPQQALSFMNAQLRGLPLSQTNMTQYQAPPSLTSQLIGAGATAYGLSQLGKKKGGSIKAKAPDNRQKQPGGLMDLALDQIGA